MAEEMGATLIIDGKTPPEELAVIYNKKLEVHRYNL